MVERNKVNWVGIQPIYPEENIPVKQSNQTLLKTTVYPGATGFGVYPVLNPNLLAVQEYNEAENSTVIIYTVPAGKTLYITTFHIFIYNVVVGLGAIFARDANDLNSQWIIGGAYPLGEARSSSINFNIPLVVPALWDICIYSSVASCLCYGGFIGYRST